MIGELRAMLSRAVGPLVVVLAAAAAILIAAGGSSSGAAATEDRVAGVTVRLDAALTSGVRRTGAAGATAAVIEHGELVWTGAAGRSRAGRGEQMQPDALFAIASTTKTVTATMAMALAEQGRLDLDAPIEDALPYLPGARRITPRMLLSHSGGLSEYFADGAIDRKASRRPYRRWTRPEVLRHVRGLKFRPGSRNGYSNSGYVALGGVVSHASGQSVARLFRRLVAQPLGLDDGSTFRYGGAPQTRFAHPLKRLRGGGFRDRFGRRGRVPTDYWGGVWTDGGLATTAAGLARIGNGLYSGDLLSPASVNAMLPPRPGGWGLGTFDQRALGATWIGHDGSYGGYQTENWTDRARGLTIVVATNAAGGGSVSPRLWRDVAAAYPG